MAKIQFTGIRNLGRLFGILAQRSVPTELNIEDGISVVYGVNEAIEQEVGITQKWFSDLTVADIATTGVLAVDPFTSSPAIPQSHAENLWLVGAGLNVATNSTPFQQATLVLLSVQADLVGPASAATGGYYPLARFGSLGSFSVGTAGIGSAETADIWITPPPIQMPSQGLFGIGTGFELQFRIRKAADAADTEFELWAVFWSAPVGVACPWR